METSFTLKRTVIGGQTAPDDWSVLLNDAVVGGIHPVVGNPSAVDQWQSFVTLPLVSPGHGTAPTMDEAKARWREAWDRLVGARRPGCRALWRAGNVLAPSILQHGAFGGFVPRWSN